MPQRARCVFRQQTCQVMSLQYLSRSSLPSFGWSPLSFFLYGLQVGIREVHRSSLRRLMCPAQDHFIFLTLLNMSMTFVLSLTQMVECKSPPDRDWTVQSPHAEMGIQQGWIKWVQKPCKCKDEQTMEHLLVCSNLPELCTHEDLEEFNPRARSFDQW